VSKLTFASLVKSLSPDSALYLLLAILRGQKEQEIQILNAAEVLYAPLIRHAFDQLTISRSKQGK
jgi:hypothetical protein